MAFLIKDKVVWIAGFPAESLPSARRVSTPSLAGDTLRVPLKTPEVQTVRSELPQPDSRTFCPSAEQLPVTNSALAPAALTGDWGAGEVKARVGAAVNLTMVD